MKDVEDNNAEQQHQLRLFLVAASYGARLELDAESLMKFAAGMGEVKTSMLQDYEGGYPLELGAICDAVTELDIRELDMPLTPTITAIARYKSNAAMRAAA
jgi:2-dehydropantoate 2-reductase